MKPSFSPNDRLDNDDDDADSHHSARNNRYMRERNADNRKEMESGMSFRVGTRVERELDGLWFPATIVGVDNDDGTFELEYDEDHNRETDIATEELRFLDETRKDSQLAKQLRNHELTAQQRELMLKDSLLLQSTDYDPKKLPTVVLHHQGESNAASGYIINGLENNIAAGNGLRGIRWLRVNTF